MGGVPAGCPRFGTNQSFDSAIAVVTIHHADAGKVNQGTGFELQQIDGVCHILLQPVGDKSFFKFGRSRSKEQKSTNLDVHLPGPQVAIKQFVLASDCFANCWRVESKTESITTVNEVPIQAVTHRTKRSKTRNPHAVYLDQSEANEIDINTLHLTIWLIKSPREAVGEDFPAYPLDGTVQTVGNRRDMWALTRYIPQYGVRPASRNSVRVVERFTGVIYTAKVFRGLGARERRDEEFRILGKKAISESIVCYLHTTQLTHMPAIITSTHEGFVSYNKCHNEILSKHPGIRFALATGMLRRLFSAMSFLHHNNIIHANVSGNSILLRMKEDTLDDVLIVDYGAAWKAPADDGTPHDNLIADGRGIMELVDRCCDIWTFRNGPPLSAKSDLDMVARTRSAARAYENVRRVAAHFFQNQGGDPASREGKKWNRLLTRKEHDLGSAQDDQIHNASLRVICHMTRAKLDTIVTGWITHRGTSEEERPRMILSLGHRYLDDLANSLYHGRWDLLPRDICAKLQSMEGDCKDPWRKFAAVREIQIDVRRIMFNDAPQLCIEAKSLLKFLALCVECYPSWAQNIRRTFSEHMSDESFYSVQQIQGLLHVLRSYGQLPSNMKHTLQDIADAGGEHTIVFHESRPVYYHVPSRMFNLSQLQHFADPDVLRNMIIEDKIKCEKFAEVRGEAGIQGCYVPISLVHTFATAFEIDLQDAPLLDGQNPALDPADFSHVSKGRIVLARKGLVGYASVTRSANQFFHYAKDPADFEDASTFLPTYFGNMKVLRLSPNGRFDHPLLSHWSKFRPADDRAILQPTSIVSPKKSRRRIQSALDRVLAQYKTARETAMPSPTKRCGTLLPVLEPYKRRKTLPAPFSPPKRPSIKVSNPEDFRWRPQPNQSFTEVNESFGFFEIKAEVDKMFDELSDSDYDSDGQESRHILGFRFHDESDESRSATEKESPLDEQTALASEASSEHQNHPNKLNLQKDPRDSHENPVSDAHPDKGTVPATKRGHSPIVPAPSEAADLRTQALVRFGLTPDESAAVQRGLDEVSLPDTEPVDWEEVNKEPANWHDPEDWSWRRIDLGLPK